MSTPTNPLELVDRYLQAVRFWLPKSARQEDLLAELGEDLRSQIEARENELGRAIDKEEVSAILKRCGAPMVVAARLGPRRHLIGPALYPIYVFVLKMVLLWIQLPIFLFILGPINVAYANGDFGEAVAKTFSELWSGVFIAAGIITLIFAIVEQTHTVAALECKWDPMKLPPMRKQERKPSLVNTVCQLVFAVFGLVWLLLLPHNPFLILGPAAAILKAAPMWHSFYLPVVLLTLLTILRPAIVLAKPEWNWFPPLGEAVQSLLSLVVLNIILHAAGLTSGGDIQPFVVLTDAAKNSGQYIHVSAIVNVSILISLVCAWVGLCVALIVHTWKFVRALRKTSSGSQQTASLQAH
jgi:hypothetical protein